MSIDAIVAGLVERGEEVTLDALGGIDALDEATASSLFPYVAHALIEAWDQLDDAGRGRAAALISTAIADCTSGVALNDTCLTVVPITPDLAITLGVKDALRTKTTERADQVAGGVAAIALRWLAYLAVIADEARPALADVLTGVARKATEPMPFAVAAAQVAGLTYDCWRDSNAVDCLTRLLSSDGDADAWFALGQARLVEALEADDHDTCISGLRSTLECFDNAANSGEQRPDARMYGHAIRFVTEWTADATVEMLDGHRAEAHTALQEYMLGGTGLPDQPMWIRPRYEAETAWIELVQRMHVATDAGPDGDAWYDSAVAIGALADVYRAANSFRPRRGTALPGAAAFPDLVAPTLAAPFVEHSQRVSFVERWLRDADEPDAYAFAQLVRERSGPVVPPKTATVGSHPAVAELINGDPAEVPAASALDLIEARLQDAKAVERAKVHPVVNQVIEDVAGQLGACADYRGAVREQLQPVIVSVIRFLARCLNAQEGGERSHTQYLFDPDAVEGDLQQDLVGWFYASGLYGFTIEAQHIGGGRIDLMVGFDGFRFVIELKREPQDASRSALFGYLRQAGAYQVTDIALGMLVVLDTTADPLAPHVRDDVWVDVLPATEPGGTDRFLLVVRVPGNRRSPSLL